MDLPNNAKKSKNRERHKANVIKAEEIPGYCGNAPIERILDYINSTDTNVKRGCKENAITPDSKKFVEKKDVKKKKKLSSSSSFQNNGGSADEDTSSKNSSEGEPSSELDGKMYIELCGKSLPNDVAHNGVIVANIGSVLSSSPPTDGQNFNGGGGNNLASNGPVNLKLCSESSTLTPIGPAHCVVDSDIPTEMSAGYAILDNASQPFDDAAEFREVKNRKIRKNNRKSKMSRNIYSQHFNSSRGRQPEGSNCCTSSRSDGEVLMLDGMPLTHRSRPKSSDRSRRKSTSSMPPSDHSSAENSDHDSVHSLPVVSKTAPPKLAKLPHTTPSSSSSTPHTSYADIAKMAMGAACKQNSTSNVNNPVRSAVISEPNSIDSVPVVGPLTVENVAKINQLESNTCGQYKNCNPNASSAYSSNGKVDKDDKVMKGLDDATRINKDQGELPCSSKLPAPHPIKKSQSNVDIHSNITEFPPLAVVNNYVKEPVVTKAKSSESSVKIVAKDCKVSKVRTSCSFSSSNETKISVPRPPVIIMDDIVCDEHQFDGELTFGFEINEKLLEMTLSDVVVVDATVKNSEISADMHRETVTPSFISPVYQAIENHEIDRTNYNYFENIKFIGSGMLIVLHLIYSR